jgi:hypothetical protein
MVSVDSVMTAARRRSGIERESVVPSSVATDLRGLRRMEEMEARRRTCGHVVILLFHNRGVRRWRRDLCVWRGVKSQYACL